MCDGSFCVHDEVDNYDLIGEKCVWSGLQAAPNAKLKIRFPLNMPRANAEGI